MSGEIVFRGEEVCVLGGHGVFLGCGLFTMGAEQADLTNI